MNSLLFSSILLTVFIMVKNSEQEIILQRCLPKADMENITIKCGMNEVIAIKEAFFSSSIVDHCPFVNNAATDQDQPDRNKSLKANNDHHHNNPLSCTDDLRLTLNSKCSGQPACLVNLRKLHVHQCSGYDGWINLKYACVARNKLNSYCNSQLQDRYGYVSNPGYPKFYPPYDCKWKLTGYPGQRIQVEILDLSIKEPRYVSSKKVFNYECTDNVAIIENGVKVMQMCGETKSNLIEYRSKINEIIINFRSYDFSPTRGLLFRYSMIDCPTLKPPSNGYMYRNASFAYYFCYFDYVFEDTGEPNKVLFCEYETYWNGTVTRCVAKENATIETQAVALGHQSSSERDEQDPKIIEDMLLDQMLLSPTTLIICGIISVCVIFTIIGMLIHSNRNYLADHITSTI